MTNSSAPARSASAPRDAWLDNIRLVAIILVVVGHAVGSSRNSSGAALALSNFLYAFHIPLFAITAGWTAQRLQASPAGLSKMTWQLLVPYAIFQVIALANGHADGLDLEWQFAVATFALWFLMSLFLWRLLAPWFRGGAGGLVAALAIALAIGFVPEINDTLSLSRTLFFFPAFLVGATYGDRLAGWLRPVAVRGVGAATLLAAMAYCAVNAETMNRLLQLGRDPYEVVGIPGTEGVLARLLTILAGIGLALACAALTPRGRIPFLTGLGAYTMYAYLLHVVIRRLLISWDLLPVAHDTTGALMIVAGATVLTIVLMTPPVRLLVRPLVEPAWVRDLALAPFRHRAGGRRASAA
ncbi:acyltransferase family protein [Nocardioides sp.]|uniref:acyltransferase family protein n=1 Tax=Nocardioides sp. TaxID=35761 RepID=UPI002BD3E37B|nr:acyltransferase family protein [Nocardioides sp.]HSX67384.1 acyltransferase family protein [Nocardioides sp.]